MRRLLQAGAAIVLFGFATVAFARDPNPAASARKSAANRIASYWRELRERHRGTRDTKRASKSGAVVTTVRGSR